MTVDGRYRMFSTLSRGASAVATVVLLMTMTGCDSADETVASRDQHSAAVPDATVVDLQQPTPSTSTGPDLGSRFAPMIESVMRVSAVPGAVVVVRTPDSSWTSAFGTRVAGQDDPVTVDDHFRVGSITKTMVSAVVLQLVEEGRLRLDDAVSKYRPDVPGGGAITIADLLDMRSGLFSYSESWSVARSLDTDPSKVWDPEDLLRVAFDHDPYFAPGTGYRYSNTNTVLVGRIVEQVTGRPLADEVSTRVLDRAALRNTTFPRSTDATMPVPYAHGHLFGTNVSALSTTDLPSGDVTEARAGSLLPTDVSMLNPSWIGAAGAVVSTANDVADYASILVDGSEIVPTNLHDQQLSSVGSRSGDPSDMSYGLGLAAFGPVIGHDGAIPGYQSFMGRDPSTGITVVVLCNLRDSPTGVRPANEIAYNIIRDLYRKP